MEAMANRLAAATSPYLLQHADNPVDWWEWGDGRVRGGAAARRAGAAQRRVRRVPLVPRDGARVVRGRGDRGVPERALRQHQGRPRGAARRGRGLHAGDHGDDRARRLADDRACSTTTATRSSPAPTSRTSRGTGSRRSGRCWRRSTTRGRDRPDEVRRVAAQTCASTCSRQAAAGVAAPIDDAVLDAAVTRLGARLRRGRAPASAARRSSRRRWCSSSCCGARRRLGRARDARRDLRGDGARRASTTSSAAASRATPSTATGWCRTSRRCSTTTR